MTPETDGPTLTKVPRPSASGGSREQFRELVWLIAVTDFRRTYAQTTLGYLWIVIGPLLYLGVVYLFVSEVIQRFVGEIPNFGALLLLNLVLFNFFRQAVGSSMGSLVSRGALVRKMPVPRLVLPSASVLSAGFVLATNLVLVMIWLIAAGIDPTWSWLLLPVLVIWLVVISTGGALLVSGAYVGTRDVGQIWPILARVLFYASPILFPIEVIPKQVLYDLLSVNPLAPLFVEARVWMVDPEAPTWFATKGTGVAGLMPFALTLVVCVLGAVVFRRASRRVAERL